MMMAMLIKRSVSPYICRHTSPSVLHALGWNVESYLVSPLRCFVDLDFFKIHPGFGALGGGTIFQKAVDRVPAADLISYFSILS